MSKVWVTSDTHLGHDKDFIWKKRGFTSVDEMNKEIIRRWNSLVAEDDIVYHLGDFIMGPLDNIKYVEQLKGDILLVAGNHDTPNRIAALSNCKNIKYIQFGYRIKESGGKHTLFFTHYPTIVANTNDTSVWNLYGHTHQTTLFYEDRYYMYHVGVDAHDCYPILLDDIIEQIKIKRRIK